MSQPTQRFPLMDECVHCGSKFPLAKPPPAPADRTQADDSAYQIAIMDDAEVKRYLHKITTMLPPSDPMVEQVPTLLPQSNVGTPTDPPPAPAAADELSRARAACTRYKGDLVTVIGELENDLKILESDAPREPSPAPVGETAPLVQEAAQALTLEWWCESCRDYRTGSMVMGDMLCASGCGNVIASYREATHPGTPGGDR